MNEKYLIVDAKKRFKQTIKLCDSLLESKELKTAKLITLKTSAETWLDKADLAYALKTTPLPIEVKQTKNPT